MPNKFISLDDYCLFTLPTQRGGLVTIPTSNFTQVVSANSADAVVSSIGFNFVFGNTSYQNISIFSQGYVRLYNSGMSPGTDNPSRTNTLNTSSMSPLLAVWWDDTQTSLTIDEANGGVWKLNTNYNNHNVFMVRWYSYDDISGSHTKTLTYELILHSGSNAIEFRYAPYKNLKTAPGSSDATIGIVSGTYRRDFVPSSLPDHPLGGSTTSNNNTLSVYSHWPHLTGSHIQPYKFFFSPPQ